MRGNGVAVYGRGAKGRLDGCEVWANAEGGVWVAGGGNPSIAGCIIRDHAGVWGGHGSGCGVYARASAAGVTVAPDCVFARNAGGDVVRAGASGDSKAGSKEGTPDGGSGGGSEGSD